MTVHRTHLALAACLAFGGLAQSAFAYTPGQVSLIEREYARQTGGAAISDAQLAYYLDRMDDGWTMARVSADIAGLRTPAARLAWRPASDYVVRDVICTSIGGRYRECAAPWRGDAMLSQKLSDAACVEGRTWGQKPGAIWVDDGCRGVFSVVRETTASRVFTRDPNYTVTCASTASGRTVCNWDRRYGDPVLVQQLSGAACVEGRGWGYDRNGQLWVDAGCRARFGYGGGSASTGTWVRDPDYAVTCTSLDGRRTTCDWDRRYGEPVLIQQISTSACIEGRDWGYDVSGGLWVNSGCRARFGLH